MKLNVVIFGELGRRSRYICEAMQKGITRLGDQASFVPFYKYPGRPSGDIACFYGLKDGKDVMFKDYVEAGRHVVFIDLGYWGREHSAGKHLGHHRFTVDQRHPGHLVMQFPCPADRFERFNLRVLPMRRDGDFILLAGMSRKSAHSYNMGVEEWEKAAVAAIHSHTDRPIVYRPKPSWDGAAPIDGTRFSPKEERLEGLLQRAYAVVTHHSNVGIDALVKGVPVFTETGIARPVSRGIVRAAGMAIDPLDDPYYPDDKERMQFFHNAAYWQWNVMEMAEGLPWMFLRQTGLLYS